MACARFFFFSSVGLEDCLIWNHSVVKRVCISSMFCFCFALITILRVILTTFYSIKIMGHISTYIGEPYFGLNLSLVLFLDGIDLTVFYRKVKPSGSM